MESFNGKLRDELLNGEIFYTLAEAKIVIEQWRRRYNTVRPHSSLGYKPPAPEVVSWTEAMREGLESLEDRKLALKSALKTKTNPVRFHPNLAGIYQDKVEQLHAALNAEDSRVEASIILRGLIDEIRLVPEDGDLRIYLVGELSQLLHLALNKKPGLRETGLQVTLVAGARFPRESLIVPVCL